MILILSFAVLLISLDKLITYLTIKRVEKNHPDKDKFSVEKNPLALHFFKEYGLVAGSFLYGIVSLFTFFFASWLFHFIVGWDISFCILCVIYLIVIVNNLKWYCRFSK